MQRFFKAEETLALDKSKTFHEPPIKVIQALSGFRSNDKSQISFEKGDYFYVKSFDLQSPNLYHVVNPLSNVSGTVDARYFETLERKTQLPSPPTELNYDKQLKRTSKPMFKNPFSGKLRTGSSRKGSVTSIFTSRSILSPKESQGNPDFTADEEYNQMFYSKRSERPIERESQFSPKEREPATIDLRGMESPSGYYSSGLSLMKVEYITVLENISDKYSIILMCKNGRSRMIHRSYADLYFFHLKLLEMFPAHAGVDFSPRIIPYLSPLPINDERNLGKELETYILESMQLPSAILTSRHWIEFLSLRSGDEELGESQMDDERSILDYIEEYNKPTIVKVKLCLATGQAYSFKAEYHCSYRAMLGSLEARLNHKIVDVFYWNENKQLTKIYGDQDLQLLFRTCPKPTLYSK